MAGSEGIDFKFIRQIHIMEPWYNMNRIEQIIGRGIRTCSHIDLPLNKRNVKIYMHGCLLQDKSMETIDLFLYKRCEEKAIKIGKITRLLKKISVDCYLNSDLQNYNSENMKKINENGLDLILSNGEEIKFFIGDKKDSPLCDYMEDCNYECNNSELVDSLDDNNSLINYNENFILMNNEVIIKKLKLLFLEKYFYTKFEIIKSLTNDSFSLEAINYSLTELLNNDNIIINDKYGRPGKIINIDDLYIYQPLEINNENSSLMNKITPINYNLENLEFKVPNKVKKPIDRKKYKMSNIKVLDEFNEDDIYTSRKGNKNEVFTRLIEIYNNILNYNKNYLKTINNKKDHIILLSDLFAIFKNSKEDNTLFNFESNNTSLHDITIVKKYIFEIVMHILVDKLSFSDHKSIIEYIYNLDDEFLYENHEEKKLLILLKKYYDLNLIENNELRGFIFNTLIVDDIYKNPTNKDNKFILFILNKNNVLELAKPYDYKNNLDELLKRKYSIDFSHDINPIGFLKQYKNGSNYEYDLKIKLLKDYKTPGLYNSGKVCTTFAQKNKDSEIDLTKILELLEINNLPKLTTSLYCILIEVILRYYSLIKKDSKQWFYDFNYSLINNFYL